MRLSWRKRAVVLAATWLGVVGVMALLEMDPRPILLAAIGAAVGAALCLMLDVSDVATPAMWHVGRGPAQVPRGSDHRIGLLQRQLTNAPVRHDNQLVHQMLVELIDDRLVTVHGLQRDDDPVRAAAVLGPDLAAFVATPPASRRLADIRYMSAILSRIEAL